MSNEEKSSLHNLLRGFWKKPIIWVAIVFTLSFLAMVLEFFGFLDWVPRWPVR